jgi:hypothetical protein
MLKVLEGKQENWPQVLQGVLFAYRTSRQKSTGYTPFFLLYGKQAKLPIENRSNEGDEAHSAAIAIDIEDDLLQDDIRQRLEVIQTVRNSVSQTASDNIAQAQAKQRREYQSRHRSKKSFKVGDKVVLWNLRRSDRKGGRMADPWLGPYTISAISAQGSYELTNKDGKVLQKKQHGVNLKLFFIRPSTNNTEEEIDDSERSKKDDLDKGETVSSKNNNKVHKLPNEKDEDSGDTLITGFEDKSGGFKFMPTQVKWRNYHAQRLSLSKPRRMQRRTDCQHLGVPVEVQNVAGDGNCFFRVISLELGGTEDDHRTIRDGIVNFMSNGNHEETFSNYTGRSSADYINQTSMNVNGTWATDTEIVATATWLQTTIYVYTAYASGNKWLKHEPLFSVEGIIVFDQCVYMTNLHDHFKRVIATACDAEM